MAEDQVLTGNPFLQLASNKRVWNLLEVHLPFSLERTVKGKPCRESGTKIKRSALGINGSFRPLGELCGAEPGMMDNTRVCLSRFPTQLKSEPPCCALDMLHPSPDVSYNYKYTSFKSQFHRSHKRKSPQPRRRSFPRLPFSSQIVVPMTALLGVGLGVNIIIAMRKRAHQCLAAARKGALSVTLLVGGEG